MNFSYKQDFVLLYKIDRVFFKTECPNSMKALRFNLLLNLVVMSPQSSRWERTAINTDRFILSSGPYLLITQHLCNVCSGTTIIMLFFLLLYWDTDCLGTFIVFSKFNLLYFIKATRLTSLSNKIQLLLNLHIFWSARRRDFFNDTSFHSPKRLLPRKLQDNTATKFFDSWYDWLFFKKPFQISIDLALSPNFHNSRCETGLCRLLIYLKWDGLCHSD